MRTFPHMLHFFEEQYDAGVFLASGRRVPRTGGVILARAESREALDTLLECDPFAQAGAARYEVVEFIPSMTCSELEFLKEY